MTISLPTRFFQVGQLVSYEHTKVRIIYGALRKDSMRKDIRAEFDLLELLENRFRRGGKKNKKRARRYSV